MATLLYRLMEYLNGEKGGRRFIDYKIGQKVKMFCLMFIK